MGAIRLILAISVVISHSGPIAGATLVGGTLAVQAFYIISGFYMALILNEKYAGHKDAYKLFLTNRLLRLFPTYAVVLVLTFLLYVIPWSLWGRAGGIVANYGLYGPSMGLGTKIGLLFSNLFLFGQDIMMFFAIDQRSGAVVFAPDLAAANVPLWNFLLVPQAWTIAVELTFYLVAPFLVRKSIWSLLCVILASLVLRFSTYALGYEVDPWTYRFFPFELGFFLAGAVGYRIFKRVQGVPRARVAGTAFGIAIILATGFFPDIPLPTAAKQWLYYGIFACAVPFVFLVSRESRVDRWIGELSYPVYMCHMLVLGVTGYGARWPHIPEQYLGLVVCTLSVAFSVVLSRFIMEPVEKIRQARVQRVPPGAIHRTAVAGA